MGKLITSKKKYVVEMTLEEMFRQPAILHLDELKEGMNYMTAIGNFISAAAWRIIYKHSKPEKNLVNPKVSGVGKVTVEFEVEE